MYTGTMINDLIEMVERAEDNTGARQAQDGLPAYWYAVVQHEVTGLESSWAGVA